MKFAAQALMLCVLAALTLGAAPASPLSVLLGRMHAVNGPLYNARIDSIVTGTSDSHDGPVKSSMQGLRFELQQCTGAVCLGTYFDGERLYAVNINGTALPRSPAPEPLLRGLRIVSTLQFLAPGFQTTGGRIDDDGLGDWSGHHFRKIVVSDGIATPMAVFVDPQTSLVAGAQDIDGNAFFTMRDYRRVGKFELPFEIDRNGIPLESYTSRTVSGAPLLSPRGITARLPSGGGTMQLDSQSTTPVGTCSIGGVSVRCLVDSGNSAMSVSLELAEQLNLEPVGMLKVAGLGDYATEVVRAGPLDIGNVRFGDLKYIVLSDIHHYGYDLVIGADVLASMPVTIDYTHHTVYFGSEAPIDPASTTVPLAFQNFVPVVNVTLGTRGASLAIDTGDQSNINLAYDFYARHPELFKATRVEPVSGVGGESVELIGEIGVVRIGTLQAENQQIGATKTLKGTANGHLGAGFLSQYRIVLDYAHEQMRLYPIKPM